MRKGHIAGGVIVIVLLSLVIVPLYIACVVVASETPLSHEQVLRMSSARDSLFWIWIALQVVAGWHLCSAFRSRNSLPIKLLWTGGFSILSLVCSLVSGLVLTGMEEHGWYSLAARLFL
jgi:hypothetical protein